MKEYREIIQFGDFYRILSPIETNFLCWMAVSHDKRTAIVGYYKILNEVNGPYRRVYLQGLDPKLVYHVNGDKGHSGSELMNAGLIVTDGAAGWAEKDIPSCDFDSRIYVLKA